MTNTTTPAPSEPALDRGREKWHLAWGPVAAMAITALALALFVLYSQTVRMPYGLFARLPLYGHFKPVLDPLALTVIPAALLLASAGWIVSSSTRVSAKLALAMMVGCGVVAAAAIALVRGDWRHLIRGVSTDPGSRYYTADLHFVDEYGVRDFVANHASLVPDFHAAGSKTHPAGVHLLLSALFESVGSEHPLRITTALAVLAMCGAVAAWAIGRELGGELSGRVAAVLFVAAPGPLLLAYTGLDATYATMLASAVALFMIAIHRLSPLWAAAAGAMLGLATLFTYASAFVAFAATIAIGIQATSIRHALRLLGSAALGGVAILALARVGLGFDIVASYQVVPATIGTSDPYWILGSPAAVLLWAGVPVAALGVMGLVRTVPGARKAVLPLALAVLMVVWVSLPTDVTSLRPGEVERTWAVLYPLLAAAAAPVVVHWTQRAGRKVGGAVIALLVIASVAQTALIQALWDTLF